MQHSQHPPGPLPDIGTLLPLSRNLANVVETFSISYMNETLDFTS